MRSGNGSQDHDDHDGHPGAPHDDIIENIDIGGPSMLRSAAKNHARVTVVVDPADYALVLATLPEAPSLAQRARLARIGAAFGMDVVAWSQNLTAVADGHKGLFGRVLVTRV